MMNLSAIYTPLTMSDEEGGGYVEDRLLSQRVIILGLNGDRTATCLFEDGRIQPVNYGRLKVESPFEQVGALARNGAA